MALEDCFRDSARRVAECSTVRVTQSESGMSYSLREGLNDARCTDCSEYVFELRQTSCRSCTTTLRTLSHTSAVVSTSVSPSPAATAKSRPSSATTLFSAGKPSKTHSSLTSQNDPQDLVKIARVWELQLCGYFIH